MTTDQSTTPARAGDGANEANEADEANEANDAVTVGLVGTGRMGTAIGERLLAAGVPVVVYNRTKASATALLDAGAGWAPSAAELTAQTSIVLSIVMDDAAVDRVYRGPDGLLWGKPDGMLFVEASTVRTATIYRLARDVAAVGGALVDAPISGSPQAVRERRAMVFAGGAVADFARLTYIFDMFARRATHVGPVGAGATMKLVQTMPMGIFFAGVGEALAMGAQLGLDRALMLDLFLDSQAAPPVFRDRVALLRGEVAGVGFEVKGVRKDLQAMIATAQDAGVAASTAAAALGLYAAATAAGYGEQDLVFITEYILQQARQTFTPSDQST